MRIWIMLLIFSLVIWFLWLWYRSDRKYQSKETVSIAYDSWTNDRLLERLWGEHIHLGYYHDEYKKSDFREAKIEFVHQLVKWSGLDNLPEGSRVLDIGCGIGGSARILARDYQFDVVGITVSSEQVKRAIDLTDKGLSCNFAVMDALDLQFENGSFDGVWSVEAGPHMPNKQLFADEMLRVLRPGGVLAVADWNRRDIDRRPYGFLEKLTISQLLNQWAHPDFSTIKGFQANLSNSPYSAGRFDVDDWTRLTLPSWNDSIMEGFRRPRVFLDLGPQSLFQGLREIPTILLMRWSFSIGLMRFGVFKGRG